MKRFQAIAKGRFAILRNRRTNAVTLPGDTPPASVEGSALAATLQAILQGRDAANGLITALRGFIADEQARILQIHRNGGAGQAVVRSIATLTDAVVDRKSTRLNSSH